MASPELAFLRNRPRDPQLDAIRARRDAEEAAAEQERSVIEQRASQLALEAASREARRQELVAAGARPDELPSGPGTAAPVVPVTPPRAAAAAPAPDPVAIEAGRRALRPNPAAAEMDAREAAYNADPNTFAPEAIRVDTGDGGGLRSYNPRTSEFGQPGAMQPVPAVGREDQVFRQDRTVPSGGGGFSASGGDEQYQRYLRNTMGDAPYAAERADIAHDTALASNPFAASDHETDRDIRVLSAKAQLERQEEEARRAAFMTDMTRLQGHRDATIAKLKADPVWHTLPPAEQAARLAELHDRNAEEEQKIRDAHGIGAGLSAANLYRSPAR